MWQQEEGSASITTTSPGRPPIFVANVADTTDHALNAVLEGQEQSSTGGLKSIQSLTSPEYMEFHASQFSKKGRNEDKKENIKQAETGDVLCYTINDEIK